ncbi:Ycf51 family protein [Pannus brasiliensis CCIBt3594]|uniref:Ycf51 family protein n=1 Tax=Pannus brasiliensis CCIBt3594 TaxID=1427578 RepID=A0AAW9QW20_9CHRO
MELPLDFATYAKWSGIATIACFVLTIVAFIAGWGFRFRLVGVTSFMGVLTAGIFGLGLGLFTPTEVEGAVKYSLVYDNGANQAVISLPATVTPSEVEATLKQASKNLFSYGRVGVGGDDRFTVRARTLIHPEPGLSAPLYLGEIKRSLKTRGEDSDEIQIFSKNFAKLPRTS